MDPNNASNDISGGSAKVGMVFDAFREAFKGLKRRMAAVEPGGRLPQVR